MVTQDHKAFFIIKFFQLITDRFRCNFSVFFVIIAVSVFNRVCKQEDVQFNFAQQHSQNGTKLQIMYMLLEKKQ